MSDDFKSKLKVSVWQRAIFTVILFLIHELANLATHLNLSLRRYRRHLQSLFIWAVSYEDDYNKVTKQYVGHLSKIPRHIAFSFLEPPESLNLKDVAKLVTWSLACGIQYISLYDLDGHLKCKQVDLLSLLSSVVKDKSFHLMWHDNVVDNAATMNGNNGGSVHICLLSAEDGRPDIVRAARRLAQSVAEGQLRVEDVNENAVSGALEANRGLPDPDVLVRFGLARSNMGFPPWQLRLTEIHDVDTHLGVDVQDFHLVLSKFSKCEQRFGQ